MGSVQSWHTWIESWSKWTTWHSTVWDTNCGQCQGPGAPWYSPAPHPFPSALGTGRSSIIFEISEWKKVFLNFLQVHSTFHVQCLTQNWVYGTNKWMQCVNFHKHTALWLKSLKLEKGAFLYQMLMWTDETLDVASCQEGKFILHLCLSIFLCLKKNCYFCFISDQLLLQEKKIVQIIT